VLAEGHSGAAADMLAAGLGEALGRPAPASLTFPEFAACYHWLTATLAMLGGADGRGARRAPRAPEGAAAAAPERGGPRPCNGR
jgi:hypothetical protein